MKLEIGCPALTWFNAGTYNLCQKLVPSSMIGQTLGHYRILEKIGVGGMGEVYRAFDERLERDVAVKVLPQGTLENESVRRRLRKEALILSKLSHPNIETLFDFGSMNRMEFLVVEYVAGVTLSDMLAEGPLPEKEIARLGVQLAGGLAAAHGQGVIHRDLKPTNLRFTPDGRLKILDFGIAKLLRPKQETPRADSTTESSSGDQAPIGTLPYMAPEQLRSEPANARTDIYAAGAVLYQMGSGQRPFQEDTSPRLIDAILHQPAVPPRAMNARISPELERIILKCLEKEPENRYQSAQELEVDLRQLAAPGIARPIPRPRPSKIWWRRATLAAVFAVALAAILIGLNVSGWRDRLLGRPSLARIESLAVLPLQNLSGNPEQDYFADEMTEELITHLAKIKALRVISRTSMMQYKGTRKSMPEIAHELNVDAVIEGSVVRSGDRVRITANLIHAPSDTHLWGYDQERDLRDVPSLQSDVARAIANEIRIKLTSQEQAGLAAARSVNPEAFEAYLKGRYYWNKRTGDGVRKAIGYFQQSIEKDPTYALAYAGLADCYHLLPDLTSVPASDAFPKARTAALKALEIDDRLAEAHTALANIKEDYDWDWKGAETGYKQAIELSPGYEVAHAWYSNLLLELARISEAVAEAKTAQQLDPRSVFANDNLAGTLYYAGEYDQAIAQCLKTLEIDPLSHSAHRHLARVYIQRRLYGEAVSELNKAMGLSGGKTEYLAELGYVFAIWGKKKEAHQILLELKGPSRGSYVSPYHLAIVYMGFGDKEKALERLQMAVHDRSPGVVHLKVSPLFGDLRSDPQFQKLLVEIGLSARSGSRNSN